MDAPKIELQFIEKANTLIKRSERGIVGLILKENSPQGNGIVVQYANDIPEWLSTANKEQINLALMGNETAPKKIVCYIMDGGADDISTEYNLAFEYIRKSKANILAIPPVLDDNKLVETIAFVKELRDEEKKKIIAVLPWDEREDYEGIVGLYGNAYTTDNTSTKTNGTYTADEFCSRIAGIIAGTPLTESITYVTLKGITDCDRLKKREEDEAIDKGKLVLINDGEKVKLSRGVNTLQTTTKTKGESFKKIKLVQVMDLIYDDIVMSMRDDYVGKFNCTYDDKCIIMTAINNYFDSIKGSGFITSGECNIDIEANRKYLKEKGKDVTDMTDDEIKVANTGSFVYFTGKVAIPDAIEDIIFPIYI